MANYAVAITGASGVVYGWRLLEWLLEKDHTVHLVVSEAGLLVFNHEMGLDLREAKDFRGLLESYPQENLHIHGNHEIWSVLASGSYRLDAMFVVPCTMASLAAFACGLADNLIHRAADVCIKENRLLVLVPRETPLSAIHLENMLKLARLGVRIVPAMPAFYTNPRSLEDMIDFMAGKVLDAAGIPHELYKPYGGS